MQKKGEGLYLIAWSDDKPIGHFLLRWSGPQDDRVTRHVDVTRSAFLEAGQTVDHYCRKGVATAIIRKAERLAEEKGCTHIGLEVGTTNRNAKRLYEKLGMRTGDTDNFRSAGSISIGTEIRGSTPNSSFICKNRFKADCRLAEKQVICAIPGDKKAFVPKKQSQSTDGHADALRLFGAS